MTLAYTITLADLEKYLDTLEGDDTYCGTANSWTDCPIANALLLKYGIRFNVMPTEFYPIESGTIRKDIESRCGPDIELLIREIDDSRGEAWESLPISKKQVKTIIDRFRREGKLHA